MSKENILNKKATQSAAHSVSTSEPTGGQSLSPPPLQLKASVIQKKDEEEKTIGWHPKDVKGPYAHITHSSDNFQVGAGMLRKEFQNGGFIDAMNANFIAGKYGEEGSVRRGFKADAQMINMNSGNNGLFNNNLGGDMSNFNAAAEASIGQDGFTLGASANLVSGALRVGNVDAQDARDEQVRFGGSLGAGAGVRGHWGDADKDGRREYGFGADIPLGGPLAGVSFDVKTEDPALTYMKSMPGLNLLGQGIDLAAGDSDFNLTESIGKGAQATGKGISDGASSAANWIDDKILPEGLTINPTKVDWSNPFGLW